eukprot:Nitzschia sp. Nitz4//scaffold69_size99277//23150//23851//NITZ4_004623-RA/size99277-processed-gene-0.33-mRNA-1//-1//CDS//3329556685//7405//frame0
MPCGPLGCNIYTLICDKTKESVVIDPATHSSEEFDVLQHHLEGTKVKHILLTHGHPDHVAGAADAARAWPHATLAIHPLDMENYNEAQQLGAMFGMDIPDLPQPTHELKDRDVITIGENIELEVVHTPGHAPGHVAFVDGKSSPDNDGSVVVGGDLLFRGSVGRTDFHNSNVDDLFASLRRIYNEHDDETIVLSGHTTPTFLKNERKTNPFVYSALERSDEWFQEAVDRNEWK